MSTVISVEKLGKRYLLKHQSKERYATLRDALMDNVRNVGRAVLHPLSSMSREASQEEFWALKDVDIDIQQGDRVGIVGRNGAGKSTLLKILSRITEPTSGKVHLRGRVASLLEVGTGFHPELTGRENIYLNGAILGMSRAEIQRKFDEIVDFAEIERFLDTPVKRYSSGMYVRLAFAVAAHLEPEILIVDEVLAVGDAAFQKKCMDKMGTLKAGGRTLLFVSHNVSAIKLLCDKGVFLQQGTVGYFGGIEEAVKCYYQGFAGGEQNNIINYHENFIKIDRFTFNGSDSASQVVGFKDRNLCVKVEGYASKPEVIYLELKIFDKNFNCLAYYTPRRFPQKLPTIASGRFELSADVIMPDITKGEYFLSIYVAKGNVYEGVVAEIDRAFAIEFEGFPLANGWAVKYENGNGFVLLDKVGT